MKYTLQWIYFHTFNLCMELRGFRKEVSHEINYARTTTLKGRRQNSGVGNYRPTTLPQVWQPLASSKSQTPFSRYPL